MYLDHFGLQRQPFKITPDTSLFYPGNRRGAALEAIKYAVASGEGIVKVVGEVGSGKTMLCRMLEIELPDHIEIVYIAHPSLSPENILHVIGFELKLPIDNNSSKLEVMQQLQHYLVNKHAAGRQVVVFVEEAQGMPLETLEEIRLLSNLETGEHKLLQMVLFGQPELDEKLRDPSIRQLKERITHSFYLDPFPQRDIYDYLNFRMRAVGYRGADIFSPSTAKSIQRKSKGLTRRINILADKALMAVYSEGATSVQARHIALAAQDSDFGSGLDPRPWLISLATIAILTAAVWIGTLLPEHDAPVPVPFVSDLPAPTVAPTPAPPVIERGQSGLIGVADLERQLQQTRALIESAAAGDYTIQITLIDAWNDTMIRDYLAGMREISLSQPLFVYQALIGGRPVYSVLYGRYSDRESAVHDLQTLPERLRGDGAFLRTVKGVRSDIEKTRLAAN